MEMVCIEDSNHQKEEPAKRGRASRLSSAQVVAKFDIAVMWDGVLLSISHSLSLGGFAGVFCFQTLNVFNPNGSLHRNRARDPFRIPINKKFAGAIFVLCGPCDGC
jgi:hypothetical protein